MTWRVHLTNRALLRLDILGNERSTLLAAWTYPGRVSYFDLHSGIGMGDAQFGQIDPRDHESWQTLLPDLRAPNGQQFHTLIAPDATIYLDQTGAMRLQHSSLGALCLLLDEREISFDGRFVAASLEAARGIMGAVDNEGALHLYERSTPIGKFDLGLGPLSTRHPTLLNIHDQQIYVAHRQHLIVADTAGQVQQRLELHYPISHLACAADGRFLACCDRETNVIRIYARDNLTPRYQRHAEDLMVKATQVQLLADLPPSMAALNNLAINGQGMLAFALAGVICVTDTEQMTLVPQP